MRIETKRLLLRPFCEADAAAVYAYSKDVAVGQNAGWAPHRSVEESAGILRAVFLEQDTVWAMVRRDDGRLIGSVGLLGDPKRDNCHAKMLGYAMGVRDWGQGFMTEAVHAVLLYGVPAGTTLLTATCYPDNLRSRRVLEKSGFCQEGVLHGAELRYDGVLCDYISFYKPI